MVVMWGLLALVKRTAVALGRRLFDACLGDSLGLRRKRWQADFSALPLAVAFAWPGDGEGVQDLLPTW